MCHLGKTRHRRALHLDLDAADIFWTSPLSASQDAPVAPKQSRETTKAIKLHYRHTSRKGLRPGLPRGRLLRA